jgi:hypothetical protein
MSYNFILSIIDLFLSIRTLISLFVLQCAIYSELTASMFNGDDVS